jgi:dTDP-4-amino-4,6-dideoxygalactose transaminase
MLRAHGSSKSVADRHKAKKVIHEAFPVVGYNFRMSDIHAALGISQFRKFDYILKKKLKIAKRYKEAFADNKHIIPPATPKGYVHTHQSYMVRLPGGARVKDKITQRLLDRGIVVRHSIAAAHLEKPYRTMYPKLKLPETEKAAVECLTLPTFVELTAKDQDRVINEFTRAVGALI